MSIERSFVCTSFLVAALAHLPNMAVADDALLRAIIEGGVTAILNDAQNKAQTTEKSGNKGTKPQSTPPVEVLPVAEMAEMQRALLLLGYDPGPVDGKAGRKTGGALSRFLTDRGYDPYQTQIRDAQAMLLAEVNLGTAQPENDDVGTAVTFSENGSTALSFSPSKIVVKDGAALLMTGPSAVANSYFGDRDAAREYTETQEDFLKLYVLRGNPETLDDPTKTISYASIPPASDIDDLVDQSTFVMSWKGSNQFVIEDSRRAFVERYRATLLAAAQNLPSRFMDLRYLEVGAYDPSSQMLDISVFDMNGAAGLPWNFYSQGVTLDAPLPLRIPSSWKLPANEARRIVELSDAKADAYKNSTVHPAGAAAGLILALTYELQGTRKSEHGVSLDLAAVAIEVFEDATLTTKIADLPIPADAIRASNAEELSTANPSEVVAPLDGLYPYLLLVKQNPTLLEMPEFLTAAFEIRRATETKLSYGHPIYDANRPRVISSSMLGSSADPAPADLDRVRDWLATQASNLPSRVRVSDLTLSNNGAENPNEAEILPFLTFSNDYAGQNRDWVKGARTVVEAARPDAADIRFYPSGDALPTMVALAPNPAWFGIMFDSPPAGVGDLDLEVSQTEFMTAQDGTKFLLMDLKPVALMYDGPNGREYKDLSFDDSVSSSSDPSGISTFDLAGIRLGMPLEEAKLAATNFMESDVPLVEEVKNDIVLGNSVALRVRNENNVELENLTVYYDTSLVEKPVIAVSRWIGKRSVSRSEAVEEVLPSLVDRYGQPTGYQYGSQSRLYWATSPLTQAIVVEGLRYDHPCADSDFEQAYYFEPGRFSTSNSLQACGEMISAEINQEYVHILLWNTDSWQSIRDRKAASTKPAEPKAKIKF